MLRRALCRSATLLRTAGTAEAEVADRLVAPCDTLIVYMDLFPCCSERVGCGMQVPAQVSAALASCEAL